jgi:uncharacterized RDD family membrane protein YckC
MAENKKPSTTNKGEDDWNFSLDSNVVEELQKNEPEPPKNSMKGIIKTKAESSKLTLDENAVPKAKSRSEMAKEVGEEAREVEEVVFAGPASRAIAGIIDFVLLWVYVFLGKIAAPYLRIAIQVFLDKYRIKPDVNEVVFMNVLWGLAFAFIAFCLLIAPTSFAHHSWGKKIMKLKVTGVEKNFMPIGKTFMRELIYKPISMASVVGLAMYFFNDNKQTLHDKLCDTVVIVNNELDEE